MRSRVGSVVVLAPVAAACTNPFMEAVHWRLTRGNWP